MKRLIFAKAILIAGLAAAMPANAAVIFSNYSGNAVGGGYAIGSYPFPPPNGSFEIGWSFTASTDAQFAGGSILGSLASGNNSVKFSLYQDSAGQPGSLLETIILTGALAPTANNVSFASLTNPMLTAGSTYWLTATMGDAESTGYWWTPNPATSATPQAVRFNSGGWSVANNAQGAFALNSLESGAVPEPGSWALMLIGFGFIGGAMRLRSKGRDLWLRSVGARGRALR